MPFFRRERAGEIPSISEVSGREGLMRMTKSLSGSQEGGVKE